MMFRKGKAATHVGNDVGGQTDTVRWKCERVHVMQERHPSASRCPSGDREVTQKTSVLQRFVEYWFILAEAHLRWRGEDRKQKASALHPAAGAGAVHPPGTKAFLFFWSTTEEGRRGNSCHCRCWTAAKPEEAWRRRGAGWGARRPPRRASRSLRQKAQRLPVRQ